MAIKRPEYDVAVLNEAGEPVEHHIEITPGDQLRAEFEAGKNMLGPMKDAPMNHTTVWMWCALVRLGVYAHDYQTFRNRDLYAMQGVEEDPTPDPTGLSGSSEPGSSSPPTSPASPTGSPLTSTT